MAEIETIVEPDCVADDLRWESMALVGIHPPSLPVSGSLLASTTRKAVSMVYAYA
jgi:hypothetical protein